LLARIEASSLIINDSIDQQLEQRGILLQQHTSALIMTSFIMFAISESIEVWQSRERTKGKMVMFESRTTNNRFIEIPNVNYKSKSYDSLIWIKRFFEYMP
jgi:hypothetical protein